MIEPLTDYFFQDPSCLLDNLQYLPEYSPVWAGRFGVAYVNLAFDSNWKYCVSKYVNLAIARALLENDDAFLYQLKFSASEIIKIAYDCGAIPLRYSEEKLRMTLSRNMPDKSKVN